MHGATNQDTVRTIYEYYLNIFQHSFLDIIRVSKTFQFKLQKSATDFNLGIPNIFVNEREPNAITTVYMRWIFTNTYFSPRSFLMNLLYVLFAFSDPCTTLKSIVIYLDLADSFIYSVTVCDLRNKRLLTVKELQQNCFCA